jgi:D-serine deaminase-like pyridoxal phosphate-dependent protein
VIRDLPTPALLVDVEVFEANAVRMAERAATLGVALRPHAKTVKSPELLRNVIGLGAEGLTVSTLGELRSLLPLTTDFLYGVPVADGKAGRVLEAIGSHDVRLSVIVGELGNLDGIPRDPRIDVVIEIDSDGHRGGIPPDDARLEELAEAIASRHRLRGVMTHAGGSYLVDRVDVPSVAVMERAAVVTAANRLRSAGHDIEMVSVGSTPTMATVDHLEGVTEARPGVYLFGDLSLVALGACAEGDMAMSTLATVIGSSGDGRRSFIDAGWSALSQDKGVPALGKDGGLGVVVPIDGAVGDSRLVVSSANQEHGLVTTREGGPTGLETGSRVQVFPNHACATAEMHRRVTLVANGEVVGSDLRPRDW